MELHRSIILLYTLAQSSQTHTHSEILAQLKLRINYFFKFELKLNFRLAFLPAALHPHTTCHWMLSLFSFSAVSPARLPAAMIVCLRGGWLYYLRCHPSPNCLLLFLRIKRSNRSNQSNFVETVQYILIYFACNLRIGGRESGTASGMLRNSYIIRLVL